jgi:hypothetical protein
MTPLPFTRAALRRSLVAKGVLLNDYSSAAVVGDAIRVNGLLDVIAGRHDNRPVKFADAFTLLFGERLK